MQHLQEVHSIIKDITLYNFYTQQQHKGHLQLQTIKVKLLVDEVVQDETLYDRLLDDDEDEEATDDLFG